MIEAGNIRDNFLKLKNRPWQGLDISIFNNQKVRLGYFKGEFGWHQHDNGDEFFLVMEGKITIELKDQKNLVLRKGDFAVLHKGTQHNLVSKEDSFVLVVEPIHLQTTRVSK